MSARLDPGDRKLLLGAGAVMLVLTVAAALVAPEPDDQDAPPTTYSAASGGAKAAFLLLQELGYTIERWERPLGELPKESGNVLVVAQVRRMPSPADQQAAGEFAKAGGRVVATGFHGLWLFPSAARGFRYVSNDREWRKYRAMAPSPVTAQAPEITMRAEAATDPAGAPGVALYGDGERRAVVAAYRLGQGEVIWWGGPTPLTNAGTQEPGNLQLLLNSIGPPGRGRVLWVEPRGERGRGTLLAYLARPPVVWGAAQLAVLALFVVLTFSRRSGPVRAAPVPSRLSPLEFVETLGGLYEQAGASPAALEAAWQRFRFLLPRRLALPAGATSREMAEAARERLGFREPELFQTMARCERAVERTGHAGRDLTDEEALRLVQTLYDYTRILKLEPGRPRANDARRETSAWKT